jgi:hypothetical protein
MKKTQALLISLKYFAIISVFIGAFYALAPYFLPESWYHKFAYFFYGEEYATKALPTLAALPGMQDMIHRVFGSLFLLSGLLNFSNALRISFPLLHKLFGRLFLVCCLVNAIGGIILGINSPFAGVPESIVIVIFGTFLLCAASIGLWQIRKRKIQLHKEWMIRTFAIGSGTITTRYFAVLLIQGSNISTEEILVTTLWIGFITNMVLAEIWIVTSRIFPFRKTKKISLLKNIKKPLKKDLLNPEISEGFQNA